MTQGVEYNAFIQCNPEDTHVTRPKGYLRELTSQPIGLDLAIQTQLDLPPLFSSRPLWTGSLLSRLDHGARFPSALDPDGRPIVARRGDSPLADLKCLGRFSAFSNEQAMFPQLKSVFHPRPYFARLSRTSDLAPRLQPEEQLAKPAGSVHVTAC